MKNTMKNHISTLLTLFAVLFAACSARAQLSFAPGTTLANTIINTSGDSGPLEPLSTGYYFWMVDDSTNAVAQPAALWRLNDNTPNTGINYNTMNYIGSETDNGYYYETYQDNIDANNAAALGYYYDVSSNAGEYYRGCEGGGYTYFESGTFVAGSATAPDITGGISMVVSNANGSSYQITLPPPHRTTEWGYPSKPIYEGVFSITNVINPPSPPWGRPPIGLMRAAGGDYELRQINRSSYILILYDPNNKVYYYNMVLVWTATNTAQIYSQDTNGVTVSTATVSAPAVDNQQQIKINITGNGSVSPDLNGQTLQIGKTYTLTAFPAPGNQLLGWYSDGMLWGTDMGYSYYGSDLSTVTAFGDWLNPGGAPQTMHFVMSPYINQINVNFGPANYNGGMTNGTFIGLYGPGDPDLVNTTNAGQLTVTVTSGNATAKLVGATTWTALPTFKFKSDGTAVVTNTAGSRLELTADDSAGYIVLRGLLKEKSMIVPVTLIQTAKAIDDPNNGAPSNGAIYDGLYTFFTDVPDDNTSPDGYCVGTLKTTIGSATATVTLTLADGSVITDGTAITKKGLVPFFGNVNKGAAITFGWIAPDRYSGGGYRNGALQWSAKPTAHYPAGFNTLRDMHISWPNATSYPLSWGTGWARASNPTNGNKLDCEFTWKGNTIASSTMISTKNVHLDFIIQTNTFTDPAKGMDKTLTLVYTLDGIKSTGTFVLGDKVVLDGTKLTINSAVWAYGTAKSTVTTTVTGKIKSNPVWTGTLLNGILTGTVTDPTTKQKFNFKAAKIDDALYGFITGNGYSSRVVIWRW